MGSGGAMKMTEIPSKASRAEHFVLIHGVGGGAWCWYKIRSLLESSGHKVSCLDLKSAGIDPSDPDSILSFDDYNRPLIDFLSALPDSEQVILVGHSAGGLSITEATYKAAHKVRLAVYVAATMLRSGFSTHDDFLHGVPDLSEYGDVYEQGFGLGEDQPPTSSIIRKEFQRKLIYGMSPPEDCTLAGMLLRRGPVRALQGARFKDGCGGGEAVPRVCIKTAHDYVLTPEQQEAMIRTWPPAAVYVLESDHSPFFSAPFMLFGLLLHAAASFPPAVM